MTPFSTSSGLELADAGCDRGLVVVTDRVVIVVVIVVVVVAHSASSSQCSNTST